MRALQNGLAEVTPPASEPISLASAKAHLVVEHNLDDSLIEGFTSAAREAAERFLKQSLITRTLRWTRDDFPYGTEPLYLPYPPLVSVSSVQYVNSSGVDTTLPVEDYSVFPNSFPGCIRPAYGKSWPVARDISEAVKVEYQAGYGEDAGDIPKGIIQGMYLIIGQYYIQREQVTFGRLAKAPITAFDLMRPYRRIRV